MAAFMDDAVPDRRQNTPDVGSNYCTVMTRADDLNISLEPHLVDKLGPLRPLLPPKLAAELQPYISEPTPSTIPYTLLASISQWSRTSLGQDALKTSSSAADPQAYSMISLLAGSVTSPERHFPVQIPEHVLAAEERKRQMSDKKAIVTLLNALLSIIGSGVATWFASERWKNEWVRIILAKLLIKS
jgi:TMEM199 family protein